MLDPLPVDPFIPAIVDALRRHRRLVVVADPGAGKTTRIPPALIAEGPVLVLQPRRSAARAVARRIAQERRWQVGREVGWHVRLERRFARDTALIVATEGILTSRLQHDPLLSDVSTVVLDEFHERSIHADLALALVAEAMTARPDLRLVVMSATLEAERVAAFLQDCPVLRVPGTAHNVRITYEPSLPVVDAAERALRDTAGAILCFQPGAAETRQVVEALRRRSGAQVDIVPLHGRLTPAEQDAALAPSDRRRIIVCTNIAETSLTVPGVTTVVDAGLERIPRYDHSLAIDRLDTQKITQASADQRAGRAGRTQPGAAIRLWAATDRLTPFREPEIHRLDLSGLVLDVAAWGGDVRTLRWFDPPRQESFEQAITLLNRLGALAGASITTTGRRMVRLPLPPRLARVVVAADGHPEVIRAVTALAERQLVTRPRYAATSDLLQLLDEWNDVTDAVKQAAADIERAWSPEGRRRRQQTEVESLLRRAVFEGYPDRIARRREPRSSRFQLSTGTGAKLSDESCVRDAEFVVALDLRTSGRPNEAEARIGMASAVDRDWLVPTEVQREDYLDESGVPRSLEHLRYDALVLASRPVKPDAERAASILAAAWMTSAKSEADEQLLRRIRFAQLDVDVPQLVRSSAYAARSLRELRLADILPRETTMLLDRASPATLAVPTGRHVPLRYELDGTVSAAVKLQELFGLADTPRVGSQGEPVLMQLLAPNGRPVQLTRDLRSFWQNTYAEVRKELRGRYPKHPWPEDPMNATPTRRTGRSR